MIGIAILGGGFMGLAHAGAWAAQPGAAASRWSPSRTPAKGRQGGEGGRCGADVIEDLERRSPTRGSSLVDVCLPTPLHRQYAERAFAEGKDVLLEKPLALTVEDAEAIVEAAARSGRTLLVGMVLRYWPEYRAAARAGRARARIGTVRSRLDAAALAAADWNEWFDRPGASPAASPSTSWCTTSTSSTRCSARRGAVHARAVRRGAYGGAAARASRREHEHGAASPRAA